MTKLRYDDTVGGKPATVTWTDTMKDYFGATQQMGGCGYKTNGSIRTYDEQCDFYRNETTTDVQDPSGLMPSLNQNGVWYSASTRGGLSYDLSETSPWYKTGGLAVFINDWVGTIVYSGSSTAPKYHIWSGTQHPQLITGVLTVPSASLALTSGPDANAASNPLLKFHRSVFSRSP